MTSARVLGFVGVTALAAAAAVAFAQTTVTPIPDNAPVQTAPLTPLAPEVTTWGDVQKGATLAGTCAACHGLDGNPIDPQYPRLAGQTERYIAQQLELYRSGRRTSGMAPVMIPFAQMLSAQDSRDVGAYFATQSAGAGVADDAVIATGDHAGRQFFEVGQELFRGGDKDRGIPACLACHGPDGAGNPGPPYPRVAGQFADYSERRLQEYRNPAPDSAVASPSFQVMAGVASGLTDEEIGSLASYMQGLHRRNPAVLAVSASPVTLPTPAAGRQQDPAPDSGSGPLGGPPPAGEGETQ
ncbi:MAG: cytochrome c4 [Pseudomonadota bacterium]|nr:cytochrome c4 [Pseudomonadota bacterium]